MPFIFPGYLWLALGAAVPVIIHILNKRRYKKVQWGAMTFLLRAVREETRRIQYKDLLLMLLRALVCILLAMVIARPITRFFSTGKSENKYIILILDSSASMNSTAGVETLFEKASREAESLLREVKTGSCIGIVEGSAPARILVSKTMDVRTAEDILAEIEPTDCANDFQGALRKAGDIFAEAGAAYRKEIIIVTDLPSRVWGDDADAIKNLISGIGSDRTYVVPVSGDALHNTGIISIETHPKVTTVERPLSVSVTVANGGGFIENAISTDLFLNDNRVSSRSVEKLDPGETAQISFMIKLEEPGIHRIRAVVNEGREKYSADDIRETIVEVVSGDRILLVDGEPGPDFGEGETDYVDAALNPFFQDQPLKSFDLIRIKGFEFTPESLAGKDLVVIANLNRIDPAVAVELRKFIGKGGGVVVFLGQNVIPEEYNRLLQDEKTSVLPARIGDRIPAQRPDGQSAKLYLSQDYLQHTCMQYFSRRETASLLRVPVFNSFALDVKDIPGAGIIAKYENSMSAIVERKIKQGKVILVGTSADNDWNDLFSEPVGPVLVRRMISYLISIRKVDRQKNVGEKILLPLPPEERMAQLSLITPSKKVISLNPEIQDGKTYLSYEGKGRRGMYSFRIESETEREELVALNTNSDETFITRLSPPEFKAIYKTDTIQLLSESRGKSAGSVFRESKIGRELWWPVLLICLLLFITEIVLGRMFTAEMPSTDDMPEIARSAHRSSASAQKTATGGEQ